MTDEYSNMQFEFIAQSLQPWASRVERRVMRDVDGPRWLVVLAFVVGLAFALAVCARQIWVSMPPHWVHESEPPRAAIRVDVSSAIDSRNLRLPDETRAFSVALWTVASV
jgi:hypothetical protein